MVYDSAKTNPNERIEFSYCYVWNEKKIICE